MITYQAALVLYSFIAIFLIGNTILSSFKTKSDLIQNTVGFPRELTLESYRKVLFEDEFLRYLENFILLVIISLILVVFVTSMVSYGLSQYQFKGRTLLENYFLIGLMFPIACADGLCPRIAEIKCPSIADNIVHGIA